MKVAQYNKLARIDRVHMSYTIRGKITKVQTRKTAESSTESSKHTTHKLANPYTLSPFGIETPKRQRGHLNTQEVAQAEKLSHASSSDASAAGMDSSISSSESVHLYPCFSIHSLSGVMCSSDPPDTSSP